MLDVYACSCCLHTFLPSHFLSLNNRWCCVGVSVYMCVLFRGGVEEWGRFGWAVLSAAVNALKGHAGIAFFSNALHSEYPPPPHLWNMWRESFCETWSSAHACTCHEPAIVCRFIYGHESGSGGVFLFFLMRQLPLPSIPCPAKIVIIFKTSLKLTFCHFLLLGHFN